MNVTGWSRGLEVTGGGQGVVSHAGLALLRRLADKAGLTSGLSRALAKGFGHHPLLAACANTAEPLAWMLRRGSAGSNTGCGHRACWIEEAHVTELTGLLREGPGGDQLRATRPRQPGRCHTRTLKSPSSTQSRGQPAPAIKRTKDQG